MAAATWVTSAFATSLRRLRLGLFLFRFACFGFRLGGRVRALASAFATSTAGACAELLFKAARALVHSDLLTVTTSSVWTGFLVSAATVVVPKEAAALAHSFASVFGFAAALATAGLAFLLPVSLAAFLVATGLGVFLLAGFVSAAGVLETPPKTFAHSLSSWPWIRTGIASPSARAAVRQKVLTTWIPRAPDSAFLFASACPSVCFEASILV